ncbi:MAG: ATP-binding protein [Lentisphaerae bacterium]|nr:ATP-binding protein [Lentisphaerota bacterium]
MQKPAERTWQIANQFPAMAQAAREVFDWLVNQPLPSRVKYSVGLAIEELVTNSIKYGYSDDNEHIIRVTISIQPDYIKIVFEDDGNPFDPTAYPPPDIQKVVDSAHAGGLGIQLVRRITSKMTYERVGHINRNTLLIRRMEPGDTQVIKLNL